MAILRGMRDVADALDRMRLPWYLTGSEALAAYGSPRQTLDVDIVVAADVRQLEALADVLSPGRYVSEPATFGTRTIASLIDPAGAGKVDLIVRADDAWGREAMRRRRGWAHPTWGDVWVSSLEDLILAKLEWSEGTSELQLRDVRQLLRLNAATIDRDYLGRWATDLGLATLLASVPSQADDAT